MSSFCKFYKEVKQVSYDSGQTWENLDEYRKGDLYETESVDCGGGITQYRWVNVSGQYTCVGTTKYQKTKKQQSTDGGQTWTDVSPIEYGTGAVIEYNSQDCGYITRWIESGTTCVNYNKYVNNVEQNSYDGGITWQNTGNESASTLIEEIAVDCIGGLKLLSKTNWDNIETVDCDHYSGITKNDVPIKADYSIEQYTAYTIGNCVKYISDEAFRYVRASVIKLPNSLETIANAVFRNSSINSITIPSGVNSIGLGAFSGCTSLSSVTFAQNSQLTILKGRTFANCRSLLSIEIPSGVTEIGNTGHGEEGIGVFSGCTSLSSVTFAQNSQLTTIFDDSFIGCSSLNSIEIPNGVTEIGDAAFSGCTSLTSVTIPNSVTTIGTNTFYGCTSLLSVTIPNSITSISDYLFGGCNSLTSVTIPSSVTSIGRSAFVNCSSLLSITVNSISPPTLIGYYVFANTNDCPIYVPAQSVNAYKSASGWNEYSSRIQAK